MGGSSGSAYLVANEFHLTVDGQDRTYRLFRPVSLPMSEAAPLVIALHGYSGGALEMEGGTRFDYEAAQDGFAVVYPLGVYESWNAGTCCGIAMNQNIDDVHFISVLIDRLVTQGGIDPKRVFATGMSNGGFMVQ